MSLYETPGDSKLKSVSAIGHRPVWLSIALLLTVIYALAALTHLIVENQEAKASHAKHIAKMREINQPLRNLSIGSGELIKQLDAIVDKSEASFKENQSGFLIKAAVHGILVVTSVGYLLTSITAIGMASLGFWVASLLSFCSFILEKEIPVADYVLIVPNLGIPGVGITGEMIQLGLIIGILVLSLAKYRRPRIIEAPQKI